MGRYREQGVPFLAWLYRLAHNRVVDHYRALRPTVTLIPEVHESIEDTSAPLELNIDSADLLKALHALTGDQRDVIVLRFVQGMSGREVAQAMDKREDAVRALQFRALATLRRILAGEEAQPA
jgi:RNA polymerase sigma-70 factor, ECF subfamily